MVLFSGFTWMKQAGRFCAFCPRGRTTKSPNSSSNSNPSAAHRRRSAEVTVKVIISSRSASQHATQRNAMTLMLLLWLLLLHNGPPLDWCFPFITWDFNVIMTSWRPRPRHIFPPKRGCGVISRSDAFLVKLQVIFAGVDFKKQKSQWRSLITSQVQKGGKIDAGAKVSIHPRNRTARDMLSRQLGGRTYWLEGAKLLPDLKPYCAANQTCWIFCKKTKGEKKMNVNPTKLVNLLCSTYKFLFLWEVKSNSFISCTFLIPVLIAVLMLFSGFNVNLPIVIERQWKLKRWMKGMQKLSSTGNNDIEQLPRQTKQLPVLNREITISSKKKLFFPRLKNCNSTSSLFLKLSLQCNVEIQVLPFVLKLSSLNLSRTFPEENTPKFQSMPCQNSKSQADFRCLVASFHFAQWDKGERIVICPNQILCTKTSQNQIVNQKHNQATFSPQILDCIPAGQW